MARRLEGVRLEYHGCVLIREVSQGQNHRLKRFEHLADWLAKSGMEGMFDADGHRRLRTVPAHQFPRNSILFRPGDAVEGFALVLSGQVGVYLTGASGRDIQLYNITPGETCVQSTLGLLGDREYTAEALCETDCEIVLIPRVMFEGLLNQSSDFRQFVFRAFAERLQNMMQLLEQVAFVRVENRLARVLLAQVNANGQVISTHQELARRVGTAREVVSRRLEVFARRGLLRVDRGSLAILDAEGLREFSEFD